jgi:hypothetical protein
MLWHKIQGAGGAGGSTTLVYQTSTTAANYNSTITMPTLNVGDIIVVAQIADSSGIGTVPTELYGTGFTSLQTSTGSYSVGPGDFGVRTCLSYRVAQSGDSGSGIGGFMNGNVSETAVVAVYRPSWSSASVALQGGYVTGTSGNPTGTTIAASGSSELNITYSFASSVRVGSITGHTFGLTPDATLTHAATNLSAVSLKVLGQGPSSTDCSTDVGDSNRYNFLLSGYLEIT